MSKDTGGPAFPDMRRLELLRSVNIGAAEKEAIYCESSGMTLRDYFAAKVAAGLLAHPDCGEVGPGHETRTNCVATEAYAVADAMLKARNE